MILIIFFRQYFNLEKAGYKTLAVESQAEAESVIVKFKPDLAIFDLMMESDDSGFILCYKIKKKYRCAGYSGDSSFA